MRELNATEVAEVSGGVVPIIIGLAMLNCFIWGAVAGKELHRNGYA
jgi:lactobin A/cerein 7B family class IIb bacteriocin